VSERATRTEAWDGCWAQFIQLVIFHCALVLVGEKEVDYMAGDLDLGRQFRRCSAQVAHWRWQTPPPRTGANPGSLYWKNQRRLFTDLEMQIVALMEAKRS